MLYPLFQDIMAAWEQSKDKHSESNLFQLTSIKVLVISSRPNNGFPHGRGPQLACQSVNYHKGGSVASTGLPGPSTHSISAALPVSRM